jgi:hypothetical protein
MEGMGIQDAQAVGDHRHVQGGWENVKGKMHEEKIGLARCQCLMPVILATKETEIKRITVQSQPRKIIHKTVSRICPPQERAGGVVQGVGLSSSPSTEKKK